MEDVMTKIAAVGTGETPVESCVSPEAFEREKELIFKRSWLNIGKEEDIPKPGAYFVKEIGFLGSSIVVVRGDDGVVRSFHNVCRHRGYDVVGAPCGSSREFMCPYHGWRYDLEGRLLHIPYEYMYPNFDKTRLGLVPVATDTWRGYIYVNFDPHPRESVRESLADDICHKLKGYPFGELVRAASYSATMNVNWKLFADSFLDLQHFEYLHRRSLPDAIPKPDKMQMGDVTLHRGHRCSITPGSGVNPEHQMTPAEALAMKYRSTGLTALHPKSDNPKVDQFRSQGLFFQFPNFQAVLFYGFYFTHRFIPIAVDRTYWDFELFLEKPRNAGEKLSQEYTVVLSRDGVREDMGTLEPIQRNLNSGAVRSFMMGLPDLFIRYGHKTTSEILAAG